MANLQVRITLAGLLVSALLASCVTIPHQPVACNQIRTVSYEVGVLTTTLRLSPQPTINEVLECFGKPDAYYIATLPAERPGMLLAMYYPSKGLIFGHVSYGDGITSFNGDSLITDISIMTPGTITNTIQHGEHNANPDEVLKALRLWPAHLDVLKLEK